MSHKNHFYMRAAAVLRDHLHVFVLVFVDRKVHREHVMFYLISAATWRAVLESHICLNQRTALP